MDKQRCDLLPLLAELSRDRFYLAGGTGLALQLGHRDSIDFDFFTKKDFDTIELRQDIEQVFQGHGVKITQEKKNTISCLVDSTVQLSFLGYAYSLQRPLLQTEHFPIASIEDIAGMKLSAITARSLEKDYVDLYYILQHHSLKELMAISQKKHPSLDFALVLKSLVYFDDIAHEPIMFKEGNEVTLEKLREFFQATVTQYLGEIQKELT